MIKTILNLSDHVRNLSLLFNIDCWFFADGMIECPLSHQMKTSSLQLHSCNQVGLENGKSLTFKIRRCSVFVNLMVLRSSNTSQITAPKESGYNILVRNGGLFKRAKLSLIRKCCYLLGRGSSITTTKAYIRDRWGLGFSRFSMHALDYFYMKS